MALKSLEDSNRERATEYRRRTSNEAVPNGIACPKCGHELLDSDPSSFLMSAPPQKNVHCSADGCGYRGYRIA